MRFMTNSLLCGYWRNDKAFPLANEQSNLGFKEFKMFKKYKR